MLIPELEFNCLISLLNTELIASVLTSHSHPTVSEVHGPKAIYEISYVNTYFTTESELNIYKVMARPVITYGPHCMPRVQTRADV